MNKAGKNKLMRVGVRSVSLYLENRVSRSAAAFAYYSTLSIFPMLICIAALSGSYLSEYSEALAVSEVIPGAVMDVLLTYTSGAVEGKTAAVVIIALCAAVTSGGGAFRSIMRAIEDIYEKSRFNGAMNFFVSFLLALGFIFAIFLSMIVVLTGNWFIKLLNDLLGLGKIIGSWTWLRFVIMFGVIFLLFTALYKALLPHDNLRSGSVFPAALSAAVGLVGTGFVFSHFISMSSRYSLLYGSLASIIILMFWLYCAGIIIVAGAIINLAWNMD